jgi:hypothetical protein
MSKKKRELDVRGGCNAVFRIRGGIASIRGEGTINASLDMEGATDVTRSYLRNLAEQGGPSGLHLQDGPNREE